MNPNRWRSLLPFAAFLFSCSGVGSAPPAPVRLPMPRMIVPRTNHPPVIDGIMQPGEWDRAAACTGFVKAFDGNLVPVQSTAWVTFDSRYLYVAFRNYRAEQLTFLSAHARRGDDERIAYDPSNEVWISPPGSPPVTYQTLINVYPAVLDVKMIPSLGYSSKSWSGKWEVASHQSADAWTIEARAPIDAFGAGAIRDGAVWRALFATDVLGDSGKFRAWAPGGAFADIPRHGFVEFSDDGPAFQLLDVDSVFSGRPDFSMAVVGALGTRTSARVTVRFGPGAEATPRDITLSKTVAVAPGARENVQFSADLLASGLRSGFCEINATAGDSTLYHQIFPFVVDGAVRRPPAKLVTTPYTQPFGLEASYAPLSRKLLVKVDRYYMDQRKTVAGGSVALSDPATGRTVAESPLAPFDTDYSEFALDLSKLVVPVETEQDWARVHWQPGAPAVRPAEYRLQARLTDKTGKQVAEAAIPVKLMGYQFSWLPNNIGISDRVIPPWTPVRFDSGTVSLWNKTYALNGAGLANRITNAGAAQLSGPMTLEAVVDGQATALSSQTSAASAVTPAAADLSGELTSAHLTIETKTRVEFDGFVWNVMTIQPTKANVSWLSLVVNMPEAEGEFLVTTNGGWSSYFGDTPDKWDSRESSLSSMKGNFVPYVFLTDSERGFCWFADDEKGWRLDPKLPTQELQRHNGVITLRVHFINKAGPITQPMTIQYGWMVTPQKPQPAHWRSYAIGNGKYYPQETPVFWNEADWDVSWPYYSSPFPHDYKKSRDLLNVTASRGVAGCVGNIAHAIARYRDFNGRQFDALAGDWGTTPGDADNGDVVRSRGANDFDLFYFDRWSKMSGLGCIYFDENYLPEEWNYLTGGAYLLPDGRVQPGYDYLGLREYNKRLRYMFYENGKPAPNLWEHTTAGQAVYSWMPDVSMEGENVEPVDLTDDYIQMLPASRLRSIGMGRNLGSAPFIMCQANRHGKGEESKILVHQFVGWVLAHDVLPEGVAFWPVLASELELWRDDVRFLPYWRKGLGIDSETPGVIASAHVRPGSAVLWVVNTNREDKAVRIRVDLAKLGLDHGIPIQAYDAENGDRYPLQEGLLTVPVPKRMWRAVRLVSSRQLSESLTFVADFDHEVAAAEAWGGRYPLGSTLSEPVSGGAVEASVATHLVASGDAYPLVTSGATAGKGASLDAPLVFPARLHVSARSGMISFAVQMPESARGNSLLMELGGMQLRVVNGRLALGGSVWSAPPSAVLGTVADGSRHSVTLSWKGQEVEVNIDNSAAVTATLKNPLVLPGVGHGLEILDESRHLQPATIVFGPIHGAVLDNLRMGLIGSPHNGSSSASLRGTDAARRF
jgi:hypothetical protein